MLEVAWESHGELTWYLDLQSGDIVDRFDDPDVDEKIENDPDRFLLIESPLSPTDDFRVMEDFVLGLPESEARRDLERVLRRAKPFRNFREALRDWPEIQAQWSAVQEKQKTEAMKSWLAANEIEVIPRPAT